MQNKIERRTVIAGLAGTGAMLAMPAPLRAQGLSDLLGGGLNLSSILGRATDNALDNLAEPGAFYGDEDIRINLPIVTDGGRRGGLFGVFGQILDVTSELELLDGVTRKINDAAGVAAGEAKPIFRDAIDDLSFSDAPGIIREKDGGTQYLRRSANDRLHERLEPLVDTALDDAGVYSTFEGLAEKHSFIRRAGLDRQKINTSVTDQGLDGIFAYIGAEEREFRDNPLSGIGL